MQDRHLLWLGLAPSYYKSGNKVKAAELLKELEDVVEKKIPMWRFILQWLMLQ